MRGGEDFRPVGIAAGPDGALYITDWVDRSYPVHGKGRIWRLRAKNPRLAAKTVETRPDVIGSSTLATIQQLKASPLGTGHEGIIKYLADADPFVRVGDRVRKGQVLCIVEAMKLMNEIESDADGVVAEIYPKNAQPVEYGEALFGIRAD